MSLLLIILLPFAGSLCAALMPSNARNAEAWLAGIVALSCSLLVLSLYPSLISDGGVRVVIPWASSLGLNFSLRMDGFAWMFALLVSGMGTLIVLYARYYMSPEDPVPRFFSFFLAFMGAMLGVVLSGNLIQLALFWELTSLTSFMLIAYWHHRADARQGARTSLLVTGSGGLALLAGMLMLGHIAGSYDLDVVLASVGRVQSHPWYNATLALVAFGALTKSAQFPFHFWLPQAMAAPTPVSAYLHSATMVKAGVFLLVRLWPVLAGTDMWFWLIGGAGLCTLVIGAYTALFQNDMKGVLAYSTISHLGLITLLLGMNSPLALVAAIFHIINHATFKASLFMAAGIVDHETGTRDMRRLSGLYHFMPITATLAVVAAASMAGVPLLNGFLSKEMFFAETIFVEESSIHKLGLPLAATVASLFSVAYSLRFIHQVFFGPKAEDLPRTPHEPPLWMLVPSMLLVLACLLVGMFPAYTVGPYLNVAARSILGDLTPSFSLAVWHGFNLPLVMSLIALIGGIVFYLIFQRYQLGDKFSWPERLKAQNLFDALRNGLMVNAERLIGVLVSRRLQIQLELLITVSLGMALLPTLLTGWQWGDQAAAMLHPAFALMWLVGGISAVAAAQQAKLHRLAALILAGIAGLATALTFVWFSAPDLALTQISVEAVTTILILLGLRWLPKRDAGIRDEPAQATTLTRRLRDFTLALGGGLGMGGLAYAILSRPAVEGISPFFVEHSLPDGGGLNIVNVILVDFRSFDTFGEITVLCIVALTVYALLRRFRPASESMTLPHQQEDQETLPAPDPAVLLPQSYLMVPAVLVRLLLPIALMTSLFFLLRGHNAPGGGFVGGLILATAIILQTLVSGTIWVEARLRLRPLYWMSFGLFGAALAGVTAWFKDAPFLTSSAWHGDLPLIGEIHLSTVLLFDLGVYMMVVGTTVLILVALAHQTLRVHSRRPTAPIGEAG